MDMSIGTFRERFGGIGRGFVYIRGASSIMRWHDVEVVM
jgi:hypothetical protein